MSLNMDAVFAKLGDATTKIEDDIANGLNSLDLSNTADVMKMQQMMQKWTIATNTESNVLKTVGEGIKSTVSNIR